MRKWVAPGYVPWKLKHELQALKRIGVVVDLVIWQQGEADARDGTTVTAYRGDFLKLRSVLRANGVGAPVVVVLSTRCKAFSGAVVRQALSDLVGEQNDVWMRPDTDKLLATHVLMVATSRSRGRMRRQNCGQMPLNPRFQPLGTNR